MTTLGEIVRQYGPAYRAQYGEQLLPSQQAALHAIEQCRTEALGGHIYACPACGTLRYSYHSCRNRHCPRCQQDAAQTWLARQQDLLLSVPYFMVTFTLPAELREVARRHQHTIYALLLRASAAALQQLAHDPRFIGGQIGMIGVLQTWTRDLRYHRHVHYLVPGGGLADDGRTWVTAKADFLIHIKPLAALFQAKLRAALRQSALWSEIPAAAWQQSWVVDCRPVRNGSTALKYLARYIFRVALSNNCILGVENDQVTFRYTLGDTGQARYCTLEAEEFIGRFLQHVLPKGFVKVRYYGLFRCGNHPLLARIRSHLLLQRRIAELQPPSSDTRTTLTPDLLVCPSCGQPMRLERVLLPHNRGPPRCADQGLRQQMSLRWRRRRAIRHPQAWFSVPCRRSHGHISLRLRCYPCPAAVLVSGMQPPIGSQRVRARGHVRPRTLVEPLGWSLPHANPHLKFHTIYNSRWCAPASFNEDYVAACAPHESLVRWAAPINVILITETPDVFPTS